MAFVSFGGLDPFENLVELQRELDRLLANPGQGLSLGPSGRGVFPPVNIFEDREGGFVFRAEVPGIAPEQLGVTVEHRRLTISGERKPPEGSGAHHRRERRFGRFSRTIQLPEELDPEKGSAGCHDGVLTVHIKRREETKPRKIEVKLS
jgi:HSP20 family protein